MARLIVFRGRKKEGSFRLDRREMILGRGRSADVRVDNPLASRSHARVRFHRGAWSVEDLDSPNGLYVNGHRVHKLRLSIGDRLEIGRHTLIFEGTGSSRYDVATDEFRLESDPMSHTTVLPIEEVQSIRKRMNAQLETHLAIRGAGGTIREVLLKLPRYRIGFTADCDIRLPVEEAVDAREGAELFQSPVGYSLVSTSERYPVVINGRKVTSQLLADGDLLTIGGVRLRFHRAVHEAGKVTPWS